MHLGHQPAGRVGLAALLVAGVLAVTFGTGYTATRALSDNGSVWLRKGDSVAQINAPSRRLEATVKGTLVASPGSPLQIVQDPDGSVWIATPGSNKVYRLDQSSMAPGEPTPGNAVLSGSGVAYAVNWKQGTVTPLDARTGQPSGKPISVGGTIQSQILVGTTVYVATTKGEVVTISGTTKGKAQSVAAANEQVALAAAGSTPVAVNATQGRVIELTGSKRSIALPGVAGSSVQVASNQGGPDLWLVRGTQLVNVNLGSGATTTASLPSSGKYEAPVVVGNRAYVPNQSTNSVAVYNTGNLSPVHTFQLPGGAPGDPGGIEVVAKEGAIWADTPSAENALVLTGDGTKSQTIDKGTGKGVVNPTAAAHKPTGGKGNGQPGSKPPVTPPSGASSTPPVTTNQPLSSSSSSSPPAGITPVTTPSDTLTTTPPTGGTGSSSTSTTSTTSTTLPSGKSVTVPDLSGDSVDQACSALTNLGLKCGGDPQGQSPDSSHPPNVVTSQDPSADATAKAGDTVKYEYYTSAADVAVPDVSGQDPTAACAAISQAGLTCAQSPQTNGGVNDQLNQVTGENPSASQKVPTGTSVTITYYTDHAPVTVGQCAGVATANIGSCQTPGITYSLQEADNPASTDCNTTWGQSSANGATVPDGSTVNVFYDSHCLANLYLFVEIGKDEPNGGGSSFFQYITGASTDSASNTGAHFIGSVYTSQETGTVALYTYKHAGGSGSSASANYYHYTTTGGAPDAQWTLDATVGYVFPASGAPSGAQAAPVYVTLSGAHPQVDASYSFESSCPALGTSSNDVDWIAPYTAQTGPAANNFC